MFAVALLLSASVAISLPVAAPVLAQTSLHYQEPFGDAGGQPFLLEIPEGAKVREVAVYTNADSSVAGIEMRFEEQPGGERKTTNLVGRRVGQPVVLRLGPDEQLLELELGYVQGGGLTNFVVAHNKGAVGLPGEPNPTQRLTKRMEPGGEFAGLTIRADSERIYALGMIVRPGATPVVAEQSGPWGQNQPQEAVSGPAPWEQNNQQSAVSIAQSQEPPAPDRSGWGTAQAQQNQSWANGQTLQQQQQQQKPQQRQQDNPFAPSSGTPTGAPAWAQPAQPATSPNSQPSSGSPIWSRPGARTPDGPSFARSNRQGAPNDAASDPTNKFDGVWVAVGEDYRRAQPEPPVSSPKRAAWESRFIPPRMIRVTGTSATTLMVENVNVTQNQANRGPVMGSGQFAMRKGGENRFSGSGATVSVRPGPVARQDLMMANFSGTFGYMSGQYRRATTTDNLVLSSERKSPEVLQNRPPISDQFSNLTRVFQPNLVGYDPYEMNLLNPLGGRKASVFEQHQMQYYTFDPQISKNVLYGLRGVMTNTSLAENNRISVSSEAETQKQMARAMGQSAGGVGYKFAKEKSQALRQRSGATSEITLARIPRYTLVMDMPNMDLSYFFKTAVEDLIKGGGNYDNFLNKYGTHYAAAVTYGGVGYAEENSSTLETAETLAKKFSGGLDYKGSVKGQETGSGSISKSRGSSDLSGSGFNTGNRFFRSVGGSGTMGAGGYTVNENSVAPILYDLRPISELINPALFDTKGDGNRIRQLLQVRQGLQNRINARERSRPPLSTTKPKRPEAYRIIFHRMRCTTSGVRQRSSIQLSGEIVAQFTDSLGRNRALTLMSKPATGASIPTETVACGQSAYPMVFNNKQMVIVKSLQNPVNLSFSVSPKKLYDYREADLNFEDRLGTGVFFDIGAGIVELATGDSEAVEATRNQSDLIHFKNSDEVISLDKSPRSPGLMEKGQRKDGVWQISGGRPEIRTIKGPTLIVEYTIERLQ